MRREQRLVGPVGPVVLAADPVGTADGMALAAVVPAAAADHGITEGGTMPAAVVLGDPGGSADKESHIAVVIDVRVRVHIVHDILHVLVRARSLEEEATPEPVQQKEKTARLLLG